MKFLYEYRTRENERRSGEISAANREAAFAALRAKGIRPGVMKEAPGVFNLLFGKGKRWMAISILALGIVASLVIIRSNERTIETIELSESSPLPRHQIYGDPAMMESLGGSHFRNLMPTEADAYLAHFAQPGTEVPLGTNDAAVVAAFGRLAADGFKPQLTLCGADRTCREASELKRIVMSMREEMRRYLSDGVGTPEGYLKRLRERLRREQQIYSMAQADLKRTTDDQNWERINNSLRSVGLPTISRQNEKTEFGGLTDQRSF